MQLRWLAGLVLALVNSAAIAEIGTIDQVPAATLLIPHFEVETANIATLRDETDPIATLVTVQNTSATAILAHVTLWTDLGLATARFNIYLTGYDQETFSVANLFRRAVPVTASAGQDPTDTTSPHGPISQDINFASCNNQLPPSGDLLGIVSPLFSADLVAMHTGATGENFPLCLSHSHGDTIARGYITIDTVNNCTVRSPSDAGYLISGGAGDATNQNVMRGSYVVINRPRNLIEYESAVHIEANAANPITSTPGNPTFYGHLVAGTAADNREPLPTAFAGRAANGRTGVSYWRQGAPVSATGFTCGNDPAPFPLPQRQISVFNAAGTFQSSPAGNQLPYASGTQSGASLGITPALGWLFANLNQPGPLIRQSWVTYSQTPSSMPAGGNASYSVPGIALGDATDGDDPTNP